MNRPTGPTRRHLLKGAAAASTLPLALPGLAQAATPPRTSARRPVAKAANSLQPYASYWFPDSFPQDGEPDEGVVWTSLKQWTPDSDPDLPFNVSTVPLAERFTPRPANETARVDQARVSGLVSFGPTAGQPSQGASSVDGYAPTHWAYLDELVYWGGSSGEGIILAPHAPVIDAAHRAGVPVLGNVFLPPATYGGELRWTSELVQRTADGGFPLAGKLIEVARTYGFDGWFLNGETEGGDRQLGAQFAEFVAALREGAPELRITWYDAFTIEGRVEWQGALNDKNEQFFAQSDSLFVDFRWRSSTDRLAASAEHARGMDRDPYELWAGVDVESSGWDTDVDWDAFVPVEPADAAHVVSYGLYRPEWTWHGEEEQTPGRFHQRDDRFWTGEHHDPARPFGPGDWRPAARQIADRSTLTTLPFATTFNTGHGTAWYERGERTGDQEWLHLGLQTALPSRRWVVHGEGPRPTVGFDFAAAWGGGSSLLVTTGADFSGELELFRTRLPVDEDTVLTLVHRTENDSGPLRISVAVATEEPQTPGDRPEFTLLGEAASADGWTTTSVPLGAFAGERLAVLGVQLKPADLGGAEVRWRLGALSVGASEPAAPAPPTDVTITDTAADGDQTELRLRWNPPTGSTGPIHHYELHQLLPDGDRRYLGGTPGTAYYLPALRRSGAEEHTTIEIRAVDSGLLASDTVAVDHQW